MEDVCLVNTTQQSAFYLMQLVKSHRAISIRVCFDVSCFFEVHIPVIESQHMTFIESIQKML